MVTSDKIEDTFSIIVATDIHLGFAEKDPLRANDSFTTFEEILKIAVDRQVDFLLLGGDLFHENKPSRQCLQKCMDILRKYVFGDKPVDYEFLSDPEVIFKNSSVDSVNFEDENLNVGLPIFSIHGNHDDPAGLGQFCSLDLLSTAGLVNYFGRVVSLKEIQVVPLLFRKGVTNLALYGLSAVKDDRLHRLFEESNVRLVRPQENKEDWFNLFVLHQNRAAHGPKNHIPESFLPSFLDLVFWGHEHESLVDPEPQWNPEKEFFVTQPGSSVATSLCIGEMTSKKIGILRVYKKKFKMEEVLLQTVRPFAMDTTTDLIDLDESAEPQEAYDIILREVNKLIQVAETQLTGHPEQPKKPLIRLIVEYIHEAHFISPVLFGRAFQEIVANPGDMLKFKRISVKKESKESVLDSEAIQDAFENADLNARVETLVEDYFKTSDKPLFELSERGLGEAVRLYTDKEDKDALATIVRLQMKKTLDYLKKNASYVEDSTHEEMKVSIDGLIEQFRDQRKDKKGDEDDVNELKSELTNPHRPRQSRDIVMEEGGPPVSNTGSARGSARARGRGRGEAKTRSPRGRGRGRSRQQQPESEDEISIIDPDVEDAQPSPSPPKRGGGRASRGGKASAQRGGGNQSTITDAFSRQAPQSKSRTTGRTPAKKYNFEDSD